MKSYILLENMVFYAYHGVFEQETKVGNEYIINLKIEADLNDACLSDNLDDTISYADVYETIRKEMMIPSKLLEHIAKRIIDALKVQYPNIKEIELKLSKLNPPISGQLDAASVLLID